MPVPPRCWQCPLLCRFSDAGDDETLHALMRPAFEKRQGTKSRSVGQQRCRGRYGDLAAAREWRRPARREIGDWFAVKLW
jgi:hypothetical protein